MAPKSNAAELNAEESLEEFSSAETIQALDASDEILQTIRKFGLGNLFSLIESVEKQKIAES